MTNFILQVTLPLHDHWDIVTLHMANISDMGAHIYDFTARKRRVKECGVIFMDIIYYTFFMLSMPTTYQ